MIYNTFKAHVQLLYANKKVEYIFKQGYFETDKRRNDNGLILLTLFIAYN